MAGAGYKTFVAGTLAKASEVNTYLMQQSIMRFTTPAAATTALGANRAEGMVIYSTSDDTLYAYNGISWMAFASVIGSGAGYMAAWTGYTPTFTNITLGSSTSAFTFVQQGKTVHVRGRLSFGAGSSVTGTPSISLPVTAASSNFVATVTARAGGVDYAMYGGMTTTTLVPSAIGTAGTYANRVTASGTVPGTWTNGDNITFSVTYEAA